ncbi:MAG: hypothetical protein WAM30_07855 [Candidatus Dormiibacterota bacterium]
MTWVDTSPDGEEASERHRRIRRRGIGILQLDSQSWIVVRHLRSVFTAGGEIPDGYLEFRALTEPMSRAQAMAALEEAIANSDEQAQGGDRPQEQTPS